ncbi:hypothetical protein F4778DRAFT_777168 [Xylariomycetidae sp. FL2044]|nr:hypothetical protein F4778DRAFT_777168 [Xylariomycetidae sp. FL2044]
MRFFSTIVATLALAQGAFAVSTCRNILVTFPDKTPDDVLTRAMNDIKAAGGKITHESFAAYAPKRVIESVSNWSEQFQGVVEEDQMVQIETSFH